MSILGGITGHQNIGDKELIKWVQDKLEKAIKNSNLKYGFTCLAKGSDQIFANILIKNNIPYTAIIPSNNYEATFSEEDLNNYKRLLFKSKSSIKLNFIEPSEISFFEAGIKLVDLSDVIFAVWNSLLSKGLGGTGDIVKYAIAKEKRVIHLDNIKKEINYINYSF